MRVVFIHGVANRREGKEHDFDMSVTNRDEMLKRFVFGDANLYNPYWGKYGGKDFYTGQCIPRATGSETFGAPNSRQLEILADPAEGMGETGTQLLQIAISNRSLFVDIVTAGAGQSAGGAANLAELGNSLWKYASEGDWSWLFNVHNDRELQTVLGSQFAGWLAGQHEDGVEKFGFVSDLVDGVRYGLRTAVDSVVNYGSDKAMLQYKGKLAQMAVDFLGDVCVYLDSRGQGQACFIRDEVLSSLERAWLERADGEKVAVIAHSYGATVAMDIFSSHLDKLPDGFKVDAFVTVGAQVGFFQSMDLYQKRFADYDDPIVPPQKVPKPTCVTHWINIFDFADPLGFRAAPIIEGVDDFQFDTGGALWNSHGLYFVRPSFYVRLKERLKQKGVL